jgi:hypothetical protein
VEYSETGGCRELHNEELHNLYSSQNVIMVTKPKGMARRRHERNGDKHFVGKPEGEKYF